MRASDKAYAALRDDIIEWRLAPGAVLAEVEQSERLGVSRTPLREALGRLTRLSPQHREPTNSLEPWVTLLEALCQQSSDLQKGRT